MDTADSHTDEEASSLLDRLPYIPFSVPAFLQGLAGCGVLFVLLMIWMGVRADDTALRQQERLASKTVTIERAASPEETAGDPAAHAPAGDALVKAPIEGLYETTPAGRLPKARMEDGLTPFKAYSRPFAPVPGRPLIALAVVDMGLSAKATEAALAALPHDVTFVVTPYAEKPDAWTQSARNAGHEVWLQIPLQEEDYPRHDTGPSTLLAGATLEQNQGRLLNTLASATGYAGIVLPPAHVFSAQKFDLSPVLNQVFGRGLGVVDGRVGSAFGQKTAQEQGSPYAQTALWIDGDLRQEEIEANLRELERMAPLNGRVVAFMRPHPITLRLVREWAETLGDKGLQLAPLSAVAAQHQ